mgnify:CR=1 FL=1
MHQARTYDEPVPARPPRAPLHTVELLEQALAAATSGGIAVREEWLGGSGGGPCEIRGKQWLFIDLALPYAEQLDQALEALRALPEGAVTALPASLRAMLARRQRA